MLRLLTPMTLVSADGVAGVENDVVVGRFLLSDAAPKVDEPETAESAPDKRESIAIVGVVLVLLSIEEALSVSLGPASRC
jgi:hypothetical protein